jgi:hypothetical protein
MTQTQPGPRQSVRIALFVQAELTNSRTQERIKGWTGNVSRGGCFIKCTNPFPTWTSVRVSLTNLGQVFEAEGSVVHAVDGQGMGIAFEQVSKEHQALLDSWLANA